MFLSNRRNSEKNNFEGPISGHKNVQKKKFLDTKSYKDTISGQEIFCIDNSGNLKFQKDSVFQIFGQDKFSGEPISGQEQFRIDQVIQQN